MLVHKRLRGDTRGAAMRSDRWTRRNVFICAMIALAAILGVLAVARARFLTRHMRYDTLQPWQPVSGRWTALDGVITNQSNGRGDMILAKRWHERDFRISADIRFDQFFPETHYGDAGLVLRTLDAQPGVDSYIGYYAGIRPADEMLLLGRASFDWHELKRVELAEPVRLGEWYHLEFSAQRCNLAVTVSKEGSTGSSHIEYFDDRCLEAGGAGLRSYYARASWRNVQIVSR
jgi:hypothetical protein